MHDPTIPRPVKENTSEEVEAIGGRVGPLDSEKHEKKDNSSPTRVIQEADDISLFTRIIQEIQEVVRRAPDFHDDMLWEAARDIDIDDLSWPMLKLFLTGAKCDITTRTPEQWMRSLREVKKYLGKERNEKSGGEYNDGYNRDSTESDNEYEDEDVHGDGEEDGEGSEDGPEDDDEKASDEDEEIEGMGPVEGLLAEGGVDVEVIMEDDDNEDDEGKTSDEDTEEALYLEGQTPFGPVLYLRCWRRRLLL